MRKKEENEQVEKYTSNEIIDSIPSLEMKLMYNIQHILTSTEGDCDGDLEGDLDGDFDGLKVGLKVGFHEGDLEGVDVGFNEGDLEGDFDGADVGKEVGLVDGLDEGDLEGGLGPVGESVGESGSVGSFDGD